MKKLIWVVLGLFALTLVHGCGPCGIATAATTLGTSLNIGNLTACQWQTLFTEGPQLATQFGIPIPAVTLPPLTDEQAQDIVNFLDQHNIVTADDLKALIDSGAVTLQDLPTSLQGFWTEFQAQNPNL